MPFEDDLEHIGDRRRHHWPGFPLPPAGVAALVVKRMTWSARSHDSGSSLGEFDRSAMFARTGASG